MSVVVYWKERLAAGRPFYSESIWDESNNTRGKPTDGGAWPRAVARSALFDDYTVWHQDEYLKPYREAEYFADNPERMPQPVDELTFYATIAPWLYIVDKSRQVRTYLVPVRQFYEDRWVDTKKNRYFVRLCALKAHEAAFEIATALSPRAAVPYYTPKLSEELEAARNEYMKRINANREAMHKTMMGDRD